MSKMGFDPKSEPCSLCGRELDECGCSLAQDYSALEDALADFERDTPTQEEDDQ